MAERVESVVRELGRLAVLDRGEPAARVLAAIGDLNRAASGRAPITTVVVLAEPAAQAWYARQADEVMVLGPQAYLGEPDGRRRAQNVDHDYVVTRLLAAEIDAVWLGSGVVGSHAGFASRCETAGIAVIGHGAGRSFLNDRHALLLAAQGAGVAVLPFTSVVSTVEEAVAEAERVGFPVDIVVAGLAGRRGYHRVASEEQVRAAFPIAAAEASQALGVGTLFLQRLPGSGRRIDVDVIADHAGTVWALDVRDVSLRRGDQAVLTEAPCPGVDSAVADAVRKAAVRACSAAGLRDTAAVEFLLAPDGSFVFTGIDTHCQMGHAAVEERTGADLVRLRLDVARGAELAEGPPQGTGCAIEVRLLAVDQSAGFAPAPGRLAMLSLPVGTGVRVDAGLREGDTISSEFEPLIATVTAWGRDRAEALVRLRRALERTTVVVEGGTTNRTFLLSVLDQPAVVDGTADNTWLESFAALGLSSAAPDPVALLAAAVEAYDLDQKAVEVAFHARAARGRPEQPEDVGSRMTLLYRDAAHQLRVDRTGPGAYHVAAGAQSADVVSETVNRFERRLSSGDRRARVVVVPDGVVFRLEIDGVGHQVVREDGIAVRAGWPAFVVSVLVEEGQKVTAGDPLAVLESMKMESTVLAPFAGEVASIEVMANVQVEAGAPLMRVRASAASLKTSVTAGAVSFVGMTQRSDTSLPLCARVYAQLRSYLLGYDLDPATLRRLLTEQRRMAQVAEPADATLLACEDSLLELFADLGALYRPRAEADSDSETTLTAASTQEHLLAYLQWLDPVRAGIPDAYRERLSQALGRYGVEGLERTPELESAVVYLYRSFQRVRDLAPVVTSILERRMAHASVLAPLAGPQVRAQFDRLASATQGRFQAVADLARDVRYRYVDQPVLDAAVAEASAEMEEHLAILADDPGPYDHARRIARLVQYPHPMRSMLLHAWDGGSSHLREAVLEVYVRRFYRIRDLRDFRVLQHENQLLATAEYDVDGRAEHLVTAFLPLGELPPLSRAVAAHLSSVPGDRDVVVDLLTWREGPRPDIDKTAAEVDGLLDLTTFGRPLTQLDITVTSSEGPPAEHFRTQHLTYHQPNGGAFVEDALLRNLHPMLAARLEIWRLREFRLKRLASAEDVYLFHGVADADPKDSRLFALAEVRDLTPVHDPVTDTVSYPMLERMGLLALSAMRHALAGLPARGRPVANRMVLAVRPPWDISREDWSQLASSFLPLARGAGLQKVVLRVRVPDGEGGLKDSVLHLEGVGGHGVTVREAVAGTESIHPLNDYQRKVLVAERFGVPYPYEIVRMLAPTAGTASLLPPGRFEEHDLDPDGRLVPVDRAPGGNSAHLVVGLMTTFTDRVPEGMVRVAILSDPTKGLGNLAEPECRRINAALDLAEQMKVPVEWFAVSSGALISMDSGTENMDWIADTLRRLIEFTQGGGEINIVVTGINVGGQPYWNSEATMLMHTRGILIMTPASAMVLTGKQALDFSGGVSADDNFGIGGFDRVMGVNGQAQYWAPSFAGACTVLMRHYQLTYVVPGERFPRRHPTTDVVDRDVRVSPHAPVPGSDFSRVGDIFDAATNLDRKKPFDMRSVMRAVADQDREPLERWARWRGAETSVVWDTCVDGIPVCMLGLESRTLVRRGFVPADGPPSYTSGTLFPQSSRKTARAINAVSGNRPMVVLANLSGFDGSPESLRHWQLEYGAEIGRAVTNFRGPIVFVVVSRYHGGAFVVFSKALNPSLEIAAVEGSFASVIGGAPAAATVFTRDVRIRTEKDSRVVALREALAAASADEAGAIRAQLARTTDEVRSEKLGEVADEFNGIHTIERALRVGSVDRIIPAHQLRPYVADALQRGMAREMAVAAASR